MTEAWLFVFEREGEWRVAVYMPQMSPLFHEHERRFASASLALAFAQETAQESWRKEAFRTHIVQADPSEPPSALMQALWGKA